MIGFLFKVRKQQQQQNQSMYRNAPWALALKKLKTSFMDDPYSFKENEGKRPEEVHFNLEGKHLNYLFYPLQIVRNCDG